MTPVRKGPVFSDVLVLGPWVSLRTKIVLCPGIGLGDSGLVIVLQALNIETD